MTRDFLEGTRDAGLKVMRVQRVQVRHTFSARVRGSARDLLTCAFSVMTLQNPVLSRSYESKKTEMRESQQAYQVDLLVYHGTKMNSPQLIIENGFDVARGAYKIG